MAGDGRPVAVPTDPDTDRLLSAIDVQIADTRAAVADLLGVLGDLIETVENLSREIGFGPGANSSSDLAQRVQEIRRIRLG